jgi:hypothetical protein
VLFHVDRSTVRGRNQGDPPPFVSIVLRNTTKLATQTVQKFSCACMRRCSDLYSCAHLAAFHAQCDQFDITLTVARNSLNYTFGGFSTAAWNVDACCTNPNNNCNRDPATQEAIDCIDHVSSTDFLFGLWPQPHRLSAKSRWPKSGAKNATFAPFIDKIHHFAKTGSGQT